MKKFKIIFSAVFLLLLSKDIKAQKGEDVSYFYVEMLTVELRIELVNSINKSAGKPIVYTCIPAKIIGVKKKNEELLKQQLKLSKQVFQLLEITQEEAEQKCANQRDYH